MNKKGAMELEKLIAFLIVIAVAVIIILGWRAGWFGGFKALTGTGEKVVKGLEDIDFSELTASERDKVIEEAVSRDAQSALESAKKAMEQGDYEKAKQISDKISDNVEGKGALVDEIDIRIKIRNYVADKVSSLISQNKCFNILGQDVSETGDTEETRILKLLLKHYYTAKCYSNSKQTDRVKITIDLMTGRYPVHEITIKAVKEFTNQKT